MMQKDLNRGFPRAMSDEEPMNCSKTHTIVAGDTLYSLSYKYNVSVPVLMQVNKILNPYNLQLGQKICIPEGENNGPAPACDGMLYTVQAGDTLYLIAKRFKITLDSLMKANPTLDPYNLGIGMKLCIPNKIVDNDHCEVMDGTHMDNMGVMPPQGTAVPLPSFPVAPIPPRPTLPSRPPMNQMPPARPLPERPPACPMPEMPMPPIPGGNMGGRCPGGMIYNTQRGDTLARILDRFDISYRDLKKANPGVDFSGSLETLALCIPMDN